MAAAFPSVSRETIASALDFHELPTGTRHIIRATHSRTKVSMQGATDTGRPFAPGAGVPQGCPLSALLFVLTAHPLLAMLRRTIPELEAHMAYADDLAALTSKEALARLPSVSDAWHKALGMELNHHKATIIPLERPATGEADAADRMTQYLATLEYVKKHAILGSGSALQRPPTCGACRSKSGTREYRGRAFVAPTTHHAH